MVYPIGKRVVPPFVKLWMKKIGGMKNIPKDGRFIIVANHASYYDILAIPSVVVPYIDKHIHMYCNEKFFENFFFRKFLEWGRAIPVAVGKGRKTKINEKAFKNALNFLAKGEPIGIFPEGHRSYIDRMRKAKTGFVKLALTAKVPVIPIGIKGSRDVLPREAKFIKFKRCEIDIGKAINLGKYYKDKNNKKALRKLADDITRTIAKLAGERYDY